MKSKRKNGRTEQKRLPTKDTKPQKQNGTIWQHRILSHILNPRHIRKQYIKDHGVLAQDVREVLIWCYIGCCNHLCYCKEMHNTIWYNDVQSSKFLQYLLSDTVIMLVVHWYDSLVSLICTTASSFRNVFWSSVENWPDMINPIGTEAGPFWAQWVCTVMSWVGAPKLKPKRLFMIHHISRISTIAPCQAMAIASTIVAFHGTIDASISNLEDAGKLSLYPCDIRSSFYHCSILDFLLFSQKRLEPENHSMSAQLFDYIQRILAPLCEQPNNRNCWNYKFTTVARSWRIAAHFQLRILLTDQSNQGTHHCDLTNISRWTGRCIGVLTHQIWMRHFRTVG